MKRRLTKRELLVKKMLLNKISKALKDRGMLKKEFAVLIGLHPAIIYRVFRLDTGFSVDLLFVIETALDIKLIDVCNEPS